MPGPKARSHRSVSSVTPSISGSGSIASPSQARVEDQRGRETFQPPTLVVRTISPSADRTVSTRGPSGMLPAHDFPTP